MKEISEKVVPAAESVLQSLVNLPATALAAVMNSIHYGYDLPLATALEIEAQQFAICCTTADKEEGVQAFLAKRPPLFSGK